MAFVSIAPIEQEKNKVNDNIIRESSVSSKKEQVIVDCSIKILSIYNVDNRLQCFGADFLLVTDWINDSLAQLPPDTLDDKPKLTELCKRWLPLIQMRNVINADTVIDYFRVMDVTIGKIRHIQRIRGTFYEVLELQRFPFDAQELTIALRPAAPIQHVKLRWDPNRPCKMEPFQLPEWEVKPQLLTQSFVTDSNLSASKNSYTELWITVDATRQSTFYLWNIMFLMFLIGCTAWLNFALPIDVLSQRNDVNLVLILTAVAFKFVVTNSLPTISYLTLLDKYIIITFVYLYGVVGMSTIVTIVDNEIAELIDRISMFVFITFWVLFNALFVFYYHIIFRAKPVRKTVIQAPGEPITSRTRTVSNFINT